MKDQVIAPIGAYTALYEFISKSPNNSIRDDKLSKSDKIKHIFEIGQ